VRRLPPLPVVVVAVFMAGSLVAVAVLLRPDRSLVSLPAPPEAATSPESASNPPPPPLGAVLVAREVGPLGVALAAQQRRTTLTILSPAGGGFNHLSVRFLPSGTEATPCGSGCYTAAIASTPRTRLEIRRVGAPRYVTFNVPRDALPANELLRHVSSLYRTLRGVTYVERLASGPRYALISRWRLEAPDRTSYTIAGGAGAIVIGRRRWDRNTPSARWVPSPQLPRLPQPATAWTTARDAHIIARSALTLTLSFADPTIPAFYTLTLDRRTLRPRTLHMISNAHFMTDRYLGFSPSRQIRPPRK
jgi:hypothetical protein